MADNTKIEWCDHTANLVWGCEHVHAGCDNCYAEAWAKRYQPEPLWGKDTPRMAIDSVWKSLEKWQRQAQAAGTIRRVFVGSMMDIFEKTQRVIDRLGNPVDSRHYADEYMDTHELRLRLFLEVIPNSPNLLFLLLTKRPSNINKFIPIAWQEGAPDNVMFGTSPVDQPTFDNLKKHLLQVKGKRFLSIEPQLAAINAEDLSGIDWVIQGGESSSKARPFDPGWAHQMAEQCDLQNVPYFFKQTGSWLAKDWGLKSVKGGDLNELPDFMRIRQFPA